MARKPKRTPRERPPVDAGEERWRHHTLIMSDTPVLGRHFRNATATPLDAYHYGEIIDADQFDAGNGLRELWTHAGREPRVTGSLEPHVSGGHGEMSDKQSEAWAGLRRVLQSLDRLSASAVYDVCCLGTPAEYWAGSRGVTAHIGLLILRGGLSALGHGRRRC